MKQLILKKWHLIIWMLILFNFRLALAQQLSAPLSIGTTSYVIKSGFNHKTYRLDVSLPPKYSISDTIHYPVLYVLDGKYNFTSFFSIRKVLDLGREVKDVIIVAVDGNNLSESDWMANRFNDLTPTAVPKQDTVWSKMFNLPPGRLKSGGGPAFLNTIEYDIIPFVNRHYKTNGSRGLFGHSLGGLFAGYCLVSKPTLFQKYSINSPSFWWNNGEVLSLEKSFVKQNASLPARVFISVGALEGTPMISPVTSFADSLIVHYPGARITRHVFDGETHLSVVPAASSRTLKILYGY